MFKSLIHRWSKPRRLQCWRLTYAGRKKLKDGSIDGAYYNKMINSSYYKDFSAEKKAKYLRMYNEMKDFVDKYKKTISQPKNKK